MTFYGISEATDSVVIRAGSPVGTPNDLIYYNHGGTVTMSAGDGLCFDFFDTRYLTYGDGPAVISWVLEAASGSGTLRISDGLDPTHSANPAYTTNALGDHLISGGGPVVVGSSVTFTQLVDSATFGADPTLYLECITGTVELRQVKLRAWPPGGALGAWSHTQPSWTWPEGGFLGVPKFAAQASFTTDISAYGSDWAADLITATDNVRAALAAVTDSRAYLPTGMPAPLIQDLGAQVSDWDTGTSQYATIRGNLRASIFIWVALSDLYKERLPSLLGDFVIPPDVVSGDSGMIQQDGTATVTWVNAHALPQVQTIGSAGTSVTVEATPLNTGDLPVDDGGLGGSGTYAVTAPVWPSSGTGPAPVTTLGSTGLNTADVAFSVGSGVMGWLIQAQSTILTTYPPYPGPPGVDGAGGLDNYTVKFGVMVGGTLEPIGYSLNEPPFRVWDPSAVAATYLRNFARTDGLGGNAPRNYNKTSVQGSLRNYGYW